ncbi:sporulation integral membrane protein YlbJ [Sporanaerobacter acetigenes]|uniref:Sporulation integral membrane protein YlbJ n=1 Tax=Sporanaerobacter acetigenes DSM 13106 TaxID=1123281 RepID=A0A1M5XXR4_9FIRM|nr:sporulation integral membrane protein YlbJ [Sporanaerobacter acetigenes]SHI04605.1 sporulation integral membrane protein YlbJ [Sporanaerobacter acetigenes DSM 13106]
MQIKKNNISTIIYILISLFVLYNIIIHPQDCIKAASKGLLAWINIVVPSLFPFLVISELLIGLGFVDFIGVLLEPLMVPIFNVSGKGAFPFAMSITSGYPVGVKLVTRLRKDKKISKSEAQRLLSFSSTSGPLFMIGAISTGMLNNPLISPLIVYPHYLGAIAVGVLFRFYKMKDEKINSSPNKNLFKNAFRKLFQAKNKDNRNLGKILSDGVINGVSSIIIVGGFIVFYSVLVEILYISNFFNIFTEIFNIILPLNLNPEVIKGLLTGMLEITIGCKEIAELNGVSLLFKIVIINFLISWSGFSIHSQAMSFINSTDLNSKLYMFSKLLHGLFSAGFSYLLYNLKYKNIVYTSFSFETNYLEIITFPKWLDTLKISLQLGLYMLIFALLYGFIMSSINNIILNK